MTGPPNNRKLSLPRLIAAAGGIYALIVGLLTLLGYALDLRRLTDWTNGGISMFPNTAIAAALSGAALLLLGRIPDRKPGSSVLRALGSIVALIGGLTLLEHFTGMNLGIDTLLSQRAWGQQAAMASMRMGPPASSSYFIIGIALVLATCAGNGRRLAHVLAIVVVAIASLSLVGYLFGADQLYGAARFTGIAFQTSSVVAAIGAGLIASIPEYGFTAMLQRDDAGGVICRRLLLPSIALPLLLGWLRVRGQQAGYFDTAFGTAMLALIMIGMLCALLWWTASDVSRQVQLTRAAEQHLSSSLREADRRKDEFLATLAHELRNPLMPLTNSLELLKLAPGDAALVEESQAIMERQVSQLVRLVDDLLDVGRISHGKLELRRERVELAPILKQAIDACRPMTDRFRHQIHVSLPAQSIQLHADPIRLAQIFGNLLNNACKYTPPGGKIFISAQLEDDEVIVKIVDSGIGIPPDKLSAIFDLFTQVHGAHEQTRSGMGIGLTLVRRLVEMHAGTVEAHSQGPGHGSEFVVRLPVETTRDTASSSLSASSGCAQ